MLPVQVYRQCYLWAARTYLYMYCVPCMYVCMYYVQVLCTSAMYICMYKYDVHMYYVHSTLYLYLLLYLVQGYDVMYFAPCT